MELEKIVQMFLIFHLYEQNTNMESLENICIDIY